MCYPVSALARQVRRFGAAAARSCREPTAASPHGPGVRPARSHDGSRGPYGTFGGPTRPAFSMAIAAVEAA